ncbi:MAG: hypothetical protein ABMB14_19920 [Myxococcota bacterium]
MWAWIAACTVEAPVRRPSDAAGADPSTPAPAPTSSTPAPTSPAPSTTTTDCPLGPGSACDPFPVDPLPYVDARDTRDAPSSLIDAYACAPDTDEHGPEWWYVVTVPTAGLLSASIDEVAGDGVDIDVHLLASPDPDDCLARDHVGVSEAVEAGTYWLVLDTFVDADGVAQAGPYTLSVSFRETGDCDTVPTDVEMYWSSCAGSVPDCFTSGAGVFLATPTVGPVVLEAHLVTDADGFGGGWPSSFTDGIGDHYAASEAASGYAMNRDQPWAPAGEGGSEYGQSAYGAPLPVEDEAWYLNMYWRDRPAPGTRLIVRNPANGRAVVAAGGYETGPGSNTAIAGVSEEVHDALGTGHLDDLEIGFAADPTLPLGPIACP